MSWAGKLSYNANRRFLLPEGNIRIYMLQGNISVTITLTQGETPRNLAAYPYHMKKERNNRPKEWSETEGLDGVVLRPADGKIVTVGVANNQIELTISRYLAR